MVIDNLTLLMEMMPIEVSCIAVFISTVLLKKVGKTRTLPQHLGHSNAFLGAVLIPEPNFFLNGW